MEPTEVQPSAIDEPTETITNIDDVPADVLAELSKNKEGK